MESSYEEIKQDYDYLKKHFDKIEKEITQPKFIQYVKKECPGVLKTFQIKHCLKKLGYSPQRIVELVKTYDFKKVRPVIPDKFNDDEVFLFWIAGDGDLSRCHFVALCNMW